MWGALGAQGCSGLEDTRVFKKHCGTVTSAVLCGGGGREKLT